MTAQRANEKLKKRRTVPARTYAVWRRMLWTAGKRLEYYTNIGCCDVWVAARGKCISVFDVSVEGENS